MVQLYLYLTASCPHAVICLPLF